MCGNDSPAAGRRRRAGSDSSDDDFDSDDELDSDDEPEQLLMPVFTKKVRKSPSELFQGDHSSDFGYAWQSQSFERMHNLCFRVFRCISSPELFPVCVVRLFFCMF